VRARRLVWFVLLAALPAALPVAGCGVRAELKASSDLRAELQNELHVDANVNVNEFNGKVAVTITFQTRPGGDLDVARERAVAIARTRLPRVTRIDVFTRL
jgi:hypothetical protein